MEKDIYLELTELVFNAYSDERIKAYTQSVEKNGIEEHGYPRLVANLGFLIAHGKRNSYKEMFIKMMNLCCDELLVSFGKNSVRGFEVGNDFSVKEIIFCILELEKMGVYEKDITD
jgi:hypothetical protein